jgi:hypothetical protein
MAFYDDGRVVLYSPVVEENYFVRVTKKILSDFLSFLSLVRSRIQFISKELETQKNGT